MADRVIYLCLVLLVVMGLLSFWIAPQYEKGAWITIGALSNALSAALGAKFGSYIPGDKDEPKR